MKNPMLKITGPIVAILLLAVSFYGCKKDVLKSETDNSAADEIVQSAVATGSILAPAFKACGEVKSYTIWAGQTTNAGTLTIANDKDNLYVTYAITYPGVKIAETHLYVGDCSKVPVNKQGIPVPGQFPYKWTAATPTDYSTSYTYTIPLADIKDASGNILNCFCVYAHAKLVKANPDGTYSEWNTGWGGDTFVQNPRWLYYTTYCVQECPPPPPPPTDKCYAADATATGNGEVFKGRPGNNWFEFSTYPQPAGGDVPLVTGSTNIVIGNVNFSAPVNGEVTITVTLNEDCAKLAAGTETVKIEPSQTSPMNWLTPGAFTYKGSALTAKVPYAPYYAIHLTVNQVVDCVTGTAVCSTPM